MKKHALLGLSALVLAVSALSAGAAPGDAPGGVDPGTVTPGPVAPPPFFYDNLGSYNTTKWRKADWTSPGNCKNTVQNITHINGVMGVMKLELNDTPAGGYDYSCAEYQTTAEYGYGIYTARIKAASEDGVVTGFFVYHGACWGCPDHNEIDFEFLGNEPTKVHLNYFANGIGVNGEHERDIELGFDASSDYHTYTFDWRPYWIRWFVDGILVHHTTFEYGNPLPPLPTIPGKISVNLWTPNYLEWPTPGVFNYPGTPIHSRVDLIQWFRN